MDAANPWWHQQAVDKRILIIEHARCFDRQMSGHHLWISTAESICFMGRECWLFYWIPSFFIFVFLPMHRIFTTGCFPFLFSILADRSLTRFLGIRLNFISTFHLIFVCQQVDILTSN